MPADVDLLLRGTKRTQSAQRRQDVSGSSSRGCLAQCAARKTERQILCVLPETTAPRGTTALQHLLRRELYLLQQDTTEPTIGTSVRAVQEEQPRALVPERTNASWLMGIPNTEPQARHLHTRPEHGGCQRLVLLLSTDCILDDSARLRSRLVLPKKRGCAQNPTSPPQTEHE